ncbi:hypothetical protein BCR43DRAFT_513711 [Syncephalastrum racemosum]|uniref:RRM domain-containing protein n=1 Tax=Syncephalastrum racemosum TaxID=13706 RepID=A0A1X2HEA2_SYNRA|nr:hypothetical protein BCR43DRAFT_513711 [Syncephalastrum racemosum]
MQPLEDSTTTLVVKRVPPSKANTCYFQQHHGASAVRFMQSPAMKGTAFVDFPTRLAASNAFEQLKKARMRVEYAKPDPQQPQQGGRQPPQQLPSFRPQPQPEAKPEPPRQFTLSGPLKPPKENEGIPIAPHLGIPYPSDPQLRYRYPDPNPEILANITHAIASVPRLYVQVLHLMNKMNLPPPFVPVQSSSIPEAMQPKKRKRDDLLASDESELESDEEEKQRQEEQEKARKRLLEAREQQKKAVLMKHKKAKE